MAKEKELGGSAFFVVAGAGLCILAVPLTINWLVKLKALFTGRKPGEPHFRSATWNLVYTVVIAILYVLIYYCATFSNDDVEYFDPFEILGVDESATANAIKKAYRKLSMSAHPDKGGDAATFAKIARAYAALNDPVSMKNYARYGHPDGPQGMEGGIGLPAFMLDADYQHITLAIYATLLLGFPVGCYKCLKTPPDKKREAYDRAAQEVREYFAESLTRHTTLCEMLVLLAHAPPLVSEAGDEEEEAKPEAGASAAWTDLLERAQSSAPDELLAALKPKVAKTKLKGLAGKLDDTPGGGRLGRLNGCLLAAHMCLRKSTKDGPRELLPEEPLVAADLVWLEVLLATAPMLLGQMMATCRNNRWLGTLRRTIALRQGLALGVWPEPYEAARTQQKVIVKNLGATAPRALVEAKIRVDDDDGLDVIAQGDMVSVNLKFTRQNDGYAQLSLLGAGLELAEEAAPPTTDFQGIAAATVTHDTAALELAAACHPVLPIYAKQSAIFRAKSEQWLVVVADEDLDQIVTFWEIDRAIHPDGAKAGAMSATGKWQQKDAGRMKRKVLALSMDYFEEAASTLSFNVITRDKLEAMESERAGGDDDDRDPLSDDDDDEGSGGSGSDDSY